MGSGLSMSSVNKIKELASAREYGLALELVETQDLSKSLNPQFLRLCGEIYLYNGKYVEARRVLLMAYKIAPQAKRIMYSLMELYLKMGYRKLAKTYFDMYLADADENAEETKQLRYLYGKANHASPEELAEYLGTTYNENIDYEWSYETFLVYTMLDRQQETLSLALEYTAHFTDAPHCFVVADILEGNVEAKDVFYEDIPECEDDDPAQEESREEERKLLHAYDLRMNPPEPEIISMVDEREEQRIEFGAKHKRKKLNKEKNESEEPNLEEAEASEKKEQEATDKESAAAETTDTTDTTGKSDVSESDEEDFDDPLDKRPSFIKRAFSKLRLKGQGKTEEDAEEETEDFDAGDSVEEHLDENHSVEDQSVENSSFENSSFEKPSSEDSSFEDSLFEKSSSEDSSFENDEQDDLSDIEILLASRKSKEEEEEEESFFDDHEDLEDTEEYFEERKNHSDSIVTDDFDGDGFEAEADSVEDFGGETDAKEQESPVEKETTKHKSSIIFEAATFADEDEDELPVDDFSSEEEDEFGEFGKMRTGDEDDYDSVFVGEVEVEETKSAEEIYNDVERTFEESEAEEPEDEISEEPVEEVEETTEPLEDTIEETEATEATEEPVEEVEEETEEAVEETAELPEDTIEETEAAETAEAAEEPVEEVEEEADELEEPAEEAEEIEEAVEEAVDEIEEAVEAVEAAEESVDEVEETAELSEDIIEETETAEESVEEVEEAADELEEPAEEIEEAVEEAVDEIEEAVEAVEAAEESVEEVEEATEEVKAAEDEPWKNIHKSTLDFPVFRSSLFPEYHTASKTDTVVPKSKVTSDIHEKEQKLQENLRKEEQIQREAEALLASLGIDLSSSSVKASPIPEMTKQKPLSDVSIPVEKTTTIKKEPSRDELKASLKIDSVKRNLLSQLKESK